MRANDQLIKELESLLQAYEKEVNEALKDGYLKESAARTYLVHSQNFVKWCKGNFEPGGKNKK